MSRRTALFPIALLLIAGAAMGQEPTAGHVLQPLAGCVETEPNNSPDAPTPFPLPGTCTGSASADDPTGGFFVNYPDGNVHFVQDFWGLNLLTATPLDVELSFNGAAANLDLVVFDEGLTRSRGFSLSTSGSVEQISAGAIPAGRYVIAVLAVSGSSSYTLSVTVPGGAVAPSAPANLIAAALSPSAVQLNWTDTSSNESEFRIERKSGGGSFADIGSAAAGATSFRAEGLAASTLHTFRVKARNASGDSGYSNEASATTFASSACTADATTLCLNNGRFRVKAIWQTEAGQSGPGAAVPLTNDTGYFTFFSATNVEVVVKVLNACFPPFTNYWVFAGGLTDVLVVITVTDTVTGAVETYVNPQKTAFAPLQDTGHFKASCP